MNSKLYCINPNTKEYEEVNTIYGINIEEILDLIRDYKMSKDLKFDKFGKLEEIERLKQGYCELKEKCNRGECDCTHEEYNEMCKQNIKMDLEIERLNNIISDIHNGLEQIIEQGYDYNEIDKIAIKLISKIRELKGDSSNE